jgi:hypothetical protein
MDIEREWQLFGAVFVLVLVGFANATFHALAANYLFAAVTALSSAIATWAAYMIFVHTV